MTLTLIILFILIGLFLIWLEFFIVPGITVAGIGGVILIIGGIYFAYANAGGVVGHIVLLAALLSLAIMLVITLRSKTWQKTALQTNVEGVVEGIDKTKIKVGDTGSTISRLAPMGKVIINGEIVEAKSKLGLIDEKVNIVVLEIYSTNVMVQVV